MYTRPYICLESCTHWGWICWKSESLSSLEATKRLENPIWLFFSHKEEKAASYTVLFPSGEGRRQKECHSLLMLAFHILAKEIFRVLLLDRIKQQFSLISILFLRLISLKILLLRMSLCCRQSYKKSGIGVRRCTSGLGTWFKTKKNISILSPMSITGKDCSGV